MDWFSPIREVPLNRSEFFQKILVTLGINDGYFQDLTKKLAQNNFFKTKIVEKVVVYYPRVVGQNKA